MKNIVLAMGLLLSTLAAQAQTSKAETYRIRFVYCNNYDSKNFCAREVTDSSGQLVAGLPEKTPIVAINNVMDPARFQMMRMSLDVVDAVVKGKIQTRNGQAVLVISELM